MSLNKNNNYMSLENNDNNIKSFEKNLLNNFNLSEELIPNTETLTGNLDKNNIDKSYNNIKNNSINNMNENKYISKKEVDKSDEMKTKMSYKNSQTNISSKNDNISTSYFHEPTKVNELLYKISKRKKNSRHQSKYYDPDIGLERINDMSCSNNSSVMNFLAENALNIFLKRIDGKNIVEFFQNYLKENTNDKNQNQMILPTNELLTNSQNFIKNNKDINEKSFNSNDSIFLNRKHILSNIDNNSKNKNSNNSSFISESKKSEIFNKNYLLNNDIKPENNRRIIPMFFEQKEKNRNKLLNIKIKNNKIVNDINDINENIENVFTYTKDDEDIDFQNIFIKQFLSDNIN